MIVDVDPGAHGPALLEAISSCADHPQIVVITAFEETYMKPISLYAWSCGLPRETNHRVHDLAPHSMMFRSGHSRLIAGDV